MLTNQAEKTILVVEDDREIGEIIIEVLAGETHHHTYLVTNANAAMKVVNEMTPDLFLLDYQLPNINGLQLLDQFRTTEKLKGVPVIIMSANLPTCELAKRHIIGLAKPFDLDEFIELIKEMML